MCKQISSWVLHGITGAMIALMLPGCSNSVGGGDSSQGSGGGGAKSLAFNVSNSQVLVTTTQLSSLASGSPAASLLGYFGLPGGLPTLTFQGNPTSSLARATSSSGLSNFFAVDANGNIKSAVVSDVDVKIGYSTISPDGLYVYIALDGSDIATKAVIAEQNCGIFKVAVADNASSCFDPGYVTVDPAKRLTDYAKRLGSTIKPIQFDPAGNAYYVGWKYTIQNGVIGYNSDTNPTLRKITQAGTASTITPDSYYIQAFLVTKANTVVYNYWDPYNNRAGLRMYDIAANSTNEITPTSVVYQSSDAFYADEKDTVIFPTTDRDLAGNIDMSSNSKKRLQFAQRSSSYVGGKYVVNMPMNMFNSQGNYSEMVRMVPADDGRLYGVFVDAGYDNVSGTWKSVFNLYQILPYDPMPVASIKPLNNDFWASTNGVDVIVNKDYAYFVEKEQHVVNGVLQDAYAPRSIIKAINLRTKKELRMLDGPWVTKRYDVFSWRVVEDAVNGDVIYFTGFDNANSKMVMGKIDILTVQQGPNGSGNYLTITEISNIAGASAQIQDMEAVAAAPALASNISPPTVEQFYVDTENRNSVSIKFSQLMDRAKTNEGTVLNDVTNLTGGLPTPVNTVNVWLRNYLHMVVDNGGQTDAVTVPMAINTSYQLALNATLVRDAQARPLDCTPQIPCVKDFKTRPEFGWWAGSDAAPFAGSAIMTNTVGKVSLPYDYGSFSTTVSYLDYYWYLYYGYSYWYTGYLYWDFSNVLRLTGISDTGTLNGEATTNPNLGVSFSMRNRGYGNVTIRLVELDGSGGYVNTGTATSLDIDNTRRTVAEVTLYSGYASAQYVGTDWYGYCAVGGYYYYRGYGYCNSYQYTQGYGLPILNGQWARYNVKFVNTGIQMSVTDENGTTTQHFNTSDGNLTLFGGGGRVYALEIDLGSPKGQIYYLDDIVVDRLNPDFTTATNIFTLDFADSTLGGVGAGSNYYRVRRVYNYDYQTSRWRTEIW